MPLGVQMSFGFFNCEHRFDTRPLGLCELLENRGLKQEDDGKAL